MRIYLTQREECDHKLLASLALMLAIGTQIGGLDGAEIAANEASPCRIACRHSAEH